MKHRLLVTLCFSLLASGCGDDAGAGNASEPPTDKGAAAGNGGTAEAAAGESAYGWVYAPRGERGGAEAVYGIVQGESFLAITCDRARRALRVTALGRPERVAGPNEAIRAGDVRGEFPVRWTEAEYGGETMWDRASEIPLGHPLAAALAAHRGPIIFELTADGVPAEIPTDDAVRRVAAECRAS